MDSEVWICVQEKWENMPQAFDEYGILLTI